MERKKITLAACWFTWIWIQAIWMIIPALLPAIQQTLSLTISESSILLSFFSLGNAVSMFFAGFFSAKFGRKNTIVITVVLALFSLIFTSYINLYVLILLWIFLLGFGPGLYLPTGISLISDLFPPSKRGLYLGIHESAAPIGQALGPIIVGITSLFGVGWRGCLRLWGALAIIDVINIVMAVRDPASKLPSKGTKPRKALRAFPVMLPLMNFLLILGSTICHSSASAFFSMTPLYWTRKFGVEMSTVAFILGITRFFGFFSMIGAGRLSDKFGRIKVLLAINFLTSILMIPSAYLPFGYLVIISLSLLTAIFNPYYPVLFALISDMTPPSERSKTIGFVLSINSIIAGFTTPAIVGFLADTISFEIAWMYPIALSFLSCLFVIPLMKTKKT